MGSDRVRIAAAKAAVTASKKTGRPVDPRVAMLADSICKTCGHENHDDEPACGNLDPQFGFCICPENSR